MRSSFAYFIFAICFCAFAAAQQQVPEKLLKLDANQQRLLQERLAHLKDEESMQRKMKQALQVLANDALVQANKITPQDIEQEHERQRRRRTTTTKQEKMPEAERINREILEKMAALHGR